MNTLTTSWVDERGISDDEMETMQKLESLFSDILEVYPELDMNEVKKIYLRESELVNKRYDEPSTAEEESFRRTGLHVRYHIYHFLKQKLMEMPKEIDLAQRGLATDKMVLESFDRNSAEERMLHCLFIEELKLRERSEDPEVRASVYADRIKAKEDLFRLDARRQRYVSDVRLAEIYLARLKKDQIRFKDIVKNLHECLGIEDRLYSITDGYAPCENGNEYGYTYYE